MEENNNNNEEINFQKENNMEEKINNEEIFKNVNKEVNSNIKTDDANMNNNYTINYDGKMKKSSLFKYFVLGIIGGIIGTVLIILIILLIPSIKEKLVKKLDITYKENNGSSTSYVEIGDYDNPVIAIAEKVGPSIVGVTTEYKYNSFFGQQTAKQEGSGIIISSDGYILTNNHVINTDSSVVYSSDSQINVYLSSSEEPLIATVVGTDSETDIAILKVDATELPAVELGNSSELKVGELAVAIGNPLGMEFAGSVSVGYISALDRKLTDASGIEYNLIQTDAAINSGNSGGALVNSKGQVIGINTAKIQGTGIEGLSFAIPIDSIKDIISQLTEYGKVKRPYIGIGGRAVDEETAKKHDLKVGIYILSIDEYSAAEKAGLKIGDVIMQVDGENVKDVKQLNEIKAKHNIGDKLSLKVYRDGKEITVELTLQEQ